MSEGAEEVENSHHSREGPQWFRNRGGRFGGVVVDGILIKASEAGFCFQVGPVYSIPSR
jgi:hypothetical protein